MLAAAGIWKEGRFEKKTNTYQQQKSGKDTNDGCKMVTLEQRINEFARYNAAHRGCGAERKR